MADARVESISPSHRAVGEQLELLHRLILLMITVDMSQLAWLALHLIDALVGEEPTVSDSARIGAAAGGSIAVFWINVRLFGARRAAFVEVRMTAYQIIAILGFVISLGVFIGTCRLMLKIGGDLNESSHGHEKTHH